MSDERLRALTPAERDRLSRTTASVLWSAWADALGFISELTDARGLQRRLNGGQFSDAVAWSRRVGGRFGVTADLPAGTYSDDTQLRLATSRSISSRGFDVASFAKVEMTVWPAYALGGGRASKAAAASLSRQNTTWSTNFYEGWVDAGGNGAAMRVQPHVWAASDLSGNGFLLDVFRNSVVSHGHPRALVGAVLHALALSFALEQGTVASPGQWDDLLQEADAAVGVIGNDRELATYWLPQWESVTHSSFVDAWHQTVNEARDQFRLARSIMKKHPLDFSRVASDEMSLRNPAQRGSGLLTSVAAIATAAAHPNSVRDAGLSAASQLDTDTDTIATMAAAIVAAATAEPAPENIQDRRYMRDEADRLFRIALGMPAPAFPYPDPLYWTAPRSQLDVVGNVDGVPTIAGLGNIERIRETYVAADAEWVWVDTNFGPTMLIKRRQHLGALPPGSRPRLIQGRGSSDFGASIPTPLFDELDSPIERSVVATRARPKARPIARSRIDDLLAEVDAASFSDEQIGKAVREVSLSGTPEQLTNFVKKLRALMR